ncbi:pituitary tumor-transforming gene 1 protein-interacting protein-like [Limulus polyphemus]|uniref:Pituitary tumor-transforming gene 1 protein-interacting protein-like n=1 Tax=Limulus polyphemus TaxID=6850 RepID=A0ABM1T1L9_LIMPO|nr:pituitary tumor-transforming gene 1 protein-interacting protein-like [Limulus polyphemus]
MNALAELVEEMFLLIVTLWLISPSEQYSASQALSTSNIVATQSSSPTTSSSSQENCAVHNASCHTCVKASPKCYYCYKNKQCLFVTYEDLVSHLEECGTLENIAWGTCIINFEALVISMSVLGGIIFLGIAISCCCCCRFCHIRNKEKLQAELAKWNRQRENLKVKAEERREKRKQKLDEIREKYGLPKENPAYKRFDESAEPNMADFKT